MADPHQVRQGADHHQVGQSPVSTGPTGPHTDTVVVASPAHHDVPATAAASVGVATFSANNNFSTSGGTGAGTVDEKDSAGGTKNSEQQQLTTTTITTTPQQQQPSMSSMPPSTISTQVGPIPNAAIVVSTNPDDDANSETGKSTTSSTQPFSSPNPESEPGDDDTAKERRRSAKAHRRQQQLQGSAGGTNSQSVDPTTPRPQAYPMSLRQQLAMIKQMEQPNELPKSPSSCCQANPFTPVSLTKSGKRVSKVHKKNERGETPLHVAARRGEHRYCRRLLGDGAEVDCADYAGWTPLHEACSHGRIKCARVLIKGGANVNATGLENETCLHDTARTGNHELTWLLLYHGADRNKANTEGKLPIHLCDDDETKKLLTREAPIDTPPPSPASNADDDSLSVAEMHQSGASTPRHDSVSESGDNHNLQQHKKHLDQLEVEDTAHQQAQVSSSEPSGVDQRTMMKVETKAEDTSPPLQPFEPDTPTAGKKDHCEVKRPLVKSGSGSSANSTTPKLGGRLSSRGLALSPEMCSPSLARNLRIRDQQRHQRFHKQQQRFQSAIIAERKRRRTNSGSGGVVVSPLKKMKGEGASVNTMAADKDHGGACSSSSSKDAEKLLQYATDVYDFHSSSDSEEPASMRTARLAAKESVPTRASSMDQCQTPLNVSRSADCTPTPIATAEHYKSLTAIDTCSNSAPATPSPISAGAKLSKKERLLMGLHDGRSPKREQPIKVEKQEEMQTDDGAAASNPVEQDRKVPPLKISLGIKTSVDDEPVAGKPVHDSTGAGALPAPAAVGQTATNASSGSSGNGNNVDSSSGQQRLTRSRVRAQGIRLDEGGDSNSGTVNLHPHKRKGWKKREIQKLEAVAARQPVAISTAGVGAAEDAGATASTSTAAATATDGASKQCSPLAGSTTDASSYIRLLSKNCYEGYRQMRKTIESHWSSLDANSNRPVQQPYVPPANSDSYLINKKTYLLRATYNQPESKPTSAVDKLSEAMKQVYIEQDKCRQHLSIRHQVERERLVLFCEKEMLRIRARNARAQCPPLSAARIARDSEIYNPLAVCRLGRVTPKIRTDGETAAAEGSLLIRLNKRRSELVNRQRMESDSLFASQKMYWESELKRNGQLDVDKKWTVDKELVPVVGISEELQLLPSPLKLEQ